MCNLNISRKKQKKCETGEQAVLCTLFLNLKKVTGTDISTGIVSRAYRHPLL